MTAYATLKTGVAVDVDVKENLVTCIPGHVERHIIIDVVNGETHIERLHYIIAYDYFHVAWLGLFLHRQHEITATSGHTHHTM